MNVLITLFTDAGFCPSINVGTWAAWAKVNGKTYSQAGILRQKLPNSSLAELRAMVNGIHMIVRHIAPPSGTRIIAQTDCQYVIDALSPNSLSRKRSRRRCHAEITALRNTILPLGLVVEYRHVKGHKTGEKAPRHHVNQWCDRECRRLLLEARQQHQPPKEQDHG